MHTRALVLLAAGSAMLGAGLVACIDLFHSTADILTACELDAQTPGCGKEASAEADVDAGTDFCAWPEALARQNATHACAWLGACESPLGRNAFGSCMFEALLAYDCAANPNHPVKGETHARWDCLWQAQTCAAINACVFSQGSQQCGEAGAPFVTCASQGGVNANVRVECLGNGVPPNGENCALWGQTCGGDISVGVCGGSAGEGGIDCTAESCDDTMLHVCDDAGRDIGIDCESNGAQQCNGFPSRADTSWVACVPLPQGEAGTCAATLSAKCENGIAVSCPAGIPESLNCQTLLQGSAHACTPGQLSPPYDWTSPCVVTSSAADAGDAGDAGGAGDADDDAEAGDDDGGTAAPACSDSCDGGKLTSCYRGALFPLDCAEAGLGACQMKTTDEGTLRNAACAKP
jgi:hypothetical protein